MFWRRKKDRSDAPSVDDYLRGVNGPPATASGAPAGATPSAIMPTAADQQSAAFSLEVVDVFTITGRGTVATGELADGAAHVGQQVAIIRGGVQVGASELVGIESFRKLRRAAGPGDQVGLLLAGVSRDQLQPGDIIAGR